MTSESQNIEFKVTWRDEYLKWICGFAKAYGGTIFIGKDDSGNVADLKDSTEIFLKKRNINIKWTKRGGRFLYLEGYCTIIAQIAQKQLSKQFTA